MLTELPTSVISKVISLLPQQDVVNLSQTSFKFYEPCTHKLYKKISIQRNPLLKEKNVRGRSFKSSKFTVIAGHSRLELPESVQLKLINDRLQVLIQSLSINAKLIDHIEELVIIGNFHDDKINTALAEFWKIVRKSETIKRVQADDQDARKMFFNGDVMPASLTNYYVDGRASVFEKGMHIKELSISYTEDEIPRSILKNIEHLHIKENGNYSLKRAELQECNSGLKNIPGKSKLVGTEIEGFSGSALSFSQKIPQSSLSKLRSLTLQIYHSPQQQAKTNFLPLVKNFPWRDLQAIDLKIGCDNIACSQSCVAQFLDCVSLELICSNEAKLRSLTLSQCKVAHESYNQTHEFDVEWDLAIFGFLTTLMYTKKYKLSFLSISNEAAIGAVYSDGVEGNYLKRIHLYTRTLSNLLSFNLQPIQLELPTFFTTLANYEQPMNNLLWNGCKCVHCERTLEVLDELLMTHKYIASVWKDLTSCQLMAAIGDRLHERTTTNTAGLTAVDWDLHSNRFGLPFLCLNHKTFEEGEFERGSNDDEEEEESEYEAFFDTEESQLECPLKNRVRFSDVSVSISHYVADILLRMLNLNRGDAEGIDLGGEFENDGGSGEQTYSEIIVNGIQFAIGKERNGTNWLSCVSD
ncbi:hypothetical protein CLIB1423_12S03004 [[Candida] railenensis]|uniref:F-box domain-containing protein n=1 Tax=[Candida] railenensis TaxID=45579 RepID=A0A9P0QQS4_9ASCO|nr:hypothetical protein CLIB1423_12S03004 [[Candida] railenensis]